MPRKKSTGRSGAAKSQAYVEQVATALVQEVAKLRTGDRRGMDIDPGVVVDDLTYRTADGGLENLVVGMGSAMDKTQASRYKSPQNILQTDAEDTYRASWLARKMTNLMADEMFREWITVSWDGSGDNLHDVTKVTDEIKNLNVRWSARSCKRWSRLYGGAAFVCGLGTDDLALPFDRAKVKRGDLRWLRPFDRYRLIAVPAPLTPEPESPNYGMPNFYQLMNVNGTPITGSSNGLVHWTRVIRFEGEEVPWFKFRQNGFWHDSTLLSIVDSLKGYDTTTSGIANMVFDANVDVMGSTDLIGQIAKKDGKKVIHDRYSTGAYLKSMFRMLIIDKDKESYERKSFAFSGLSQVMNEFRIDCAGAGEYPVTKLFGTSATGLNATGEGDQTSWYDTVAGRQEAELAPPLFELVKLVTGSVLGRIPEGIKIEFDPLWQMSEAQSADVFLKKAQGRKIYFDMSVIGSELIAKTLLREGSLPDMEKSDVLLAKKLEGSARETDTVPLPGENKGNEADEPKTGAAKEAAEKQEEAAEG